MKAVIRIRATEKNVDLCERIMIRMSEMAQEMHGPDPQHLCSVTPMNGGLKFKCEEFRNQEIWCSIRIEREFRDFDWEDTHIIVTLQGDQVLIYHSILKELLEPLIGSDKNTIVNDNQLFRNGKVLGELLPDESFDCQLHPLSSSDEDQVNAA